MTKWEYRIVYVYRGESGKQYFPNGNMPPRDFQQIDLLNNYGQSGWELVNVTGRDISSAESFIAEASLSHLTEHVISIETYYFKRPINF